MILVIDPSAADPPYDQVKTQISALVVSGELAPGDKLPTVRRLAADLSLAPNTVARAYRELELAGVVSTRGRGGTFVSGNEVERAARLAAAEYASQMKALGVSAAEALTLIEKTLRAVDPSIPSRHTADLVK
jgi:GntR family transcriptional regulator